MKKNLLLLHLESLNTINYALNSTLFPALKKLEKQCVVFDHYYSTATSTLMVLSDLMYGGMCQYEGCASLDDIPDAYAYSSSVFDDLCDEGYTTGVYVYPIGGNNLAFANERHLVGFRQHIEVMADYSAYLKAIDKGTKTRPFAVLACNFISNLSLNIEVDIHRCGFDTDYWEAGNRCMDHCCGDLLALLDKKGLMEDTIIILYGDHGDDFWGHGMHEGLTHAIEPNSLLIHTPLMIWDGNPRSEAVHCQNLLQTTDLRALIVGLTEGAPADIAVTRLQNRPYAFARNEYAVQPVRANSFNKAYSVTDGRYLMLVSNHGLEMYDQMMDPACQNNMLRFFVYEEGLLKSREDGVDRFHYHFPSYWNARNQRIFRAKFYELREALRTRTQELYKAGGLDEEAMQREMRFDRIREMI